MYVVLYSSFTILRRLISWVLQYTTDFQKEFGSITEQAALDEFLATAELADTDFTAGQSKPCIRRFGSYLGSIN